MKTVNDEEEQYKQEQHEFEREEGEEQSGQPQSGETNKKGNENDEGGDK